MSDALARLRGLRVLIVEDELVIAMELEDLLKDLGCVSLDPAPTVKKALRALDGDRPDVALLDVNVQGERITPVAEALHERGIPFLLVSGYGSERLPEEALRGATHLRKPVDSRRLARALVEVLQRHERGSPDPA